MIRWRHYCRAVTACVTGDCVSRRAPLVWLLVALLSLQTVAVPAAGLMSWLPLAQRESEGESPSPEESSKETISGTPVCSASARARRAQADRLSRLESLPKLGIGSSDATTYGLGQPSELTRRNGRGCTLRC
jgi:hypothetical protein